jgi:transcriptional regulator with XRE-family HTH domain
MAIDNKLLGAAIKRVRMARGLTQAQLAEAAHLSSIALVEQGRRSVSLDSLNALAKALDIPSACLAVLGTRSTSGNKASADFVESLQQLISAVVLAQMELGIKEKGERSRQEVVKSEQKNFSEIARLFQSVASQKKSGKKTGKTRGAVASRGLERA